MEPVDQPTHSLFSNKQVKTKYFKAISASSSIEIGDGGPSAAYLRIRGSISGINLLKQNYRLKKVGYFKKRCGEGGSGDGG